MHNAYVYARRTKAGNMYMLGNIKPNIKMLGSIIYANRRNLLVTPGAKQNYCQDHKDSETRYITL